MNARLNRREEVTSVAIEVVTSEAQDIAHISADFRQAQGHRRESLRRTLTERIDDLLYTMMDAFTGTVEPDEAASLLSEHHPLTQKRLANLPPAAVPLIVIRELVSVHQVPMDRANLSNWHPFAERYRAAIV